MVSFDPGPVLAGLKDFQRVTVEHVMNRYFGENPTRRFLVADETGLGKSVVARGIVAKLIEKLEHDDTVERIDIIYVCSNQDIAHQNLSRLDVTGGRGSVSTTRLTLLACEVEQFSGTAGLSSKPVNLVAFTPGTSFDKGWRTGKAEERGLLFILLSDVMGFGGWDRRAAKVVLRATASARGLEWAIDWVRRSVGETPDRLIRDAFAAEARKTGLLDTFAELIAEVGRKDGLSLELRNRAGALIGDLRHCLAKAGVERLKPDLVIFDEFQRFRHLMDPAEGGASAELARELYDFEAAKLLLLSATPYKPYTMVEEAGAGDDHYRDFRQTLKFLCSDPDWNAALDDALTVYRSALTLTDHERQSITSGLVRDLLLRAMCRTERPRLGQDGMLREHHTTVSEVTPADLRGYVALRQLGKELDAPVSIEYWKSAPYFLNFADSYQIGDRLSIHLKGDHPLPAAILGSAQLLNAADLATYRRVEPGNARMRSLMEQTLDRGWWRLLWLPPSMPYHALGDTFAAAAKDGITKRLVFSSWNATPAVVSGLLSYEAERRLVEGSDLTNDPTSRRNRASRLEFRFEGDRPVSMSAFALFWPLPELAELVDPLVRMRQGGPIPDIGDLSRWAADAILAAVPSTGDRMYESVHDLALHWPAGTIPQSIEPPTPHERSEEDDHPHDMGGWARSIRWALAMDRSSLPSLDAVETYLPDLARLALFSPGNIAWRALGRLIGTESAVTSDGHWTAALTIAAGLRSLFNRFESVVLLDREVPGHDYWQAVLTYCANGGLQSVMDEYLHHLRSERPDGAMGDLDLLELARAAAGAIGLRTSSLRAFDPHHPHAPRGVALRCRFALRYGGRKEAAEDARQPEVRAAFNSPFWPFVLSTTSAGQEGIDFHWWCSAVVHWNTPSNPVDFEQREGRVHRFGGHAIRRNVAAAHRDAIIASADPDPWRAAYEAAQDLAELGEFSPFWVYPGEAKIERHVLTFPLSKDIERYEQLKADLATYRLAFGQPRQEDLLELMRRRGIDGGTAPEPLNLRPQIRPIA
jgi:hypothetical protein